MKYVLSKDQGVNILVLSEWINDPRSRTIMFLLDSKYRSQRVHCGREMDSMLLERQWGREEEEEEEEEGERGGERRG